MLLQNSEAMVAIDMPAGPSEVLVIADAAANPTHIAIDLLSQVRGGGRRAGHTVLRACQAWSRMAGSKQCKCLVCAAFAA